MAENPWHTDRMAAALEQIAENIKPPESPDEQLLRENRDLKQIVRNFGMELQMTLDNPPGNGLEMARQLRGIAARMASFGVPEMFK